MGSFVKKEKITITKKMYGWSKYGGGNLGMKKENYQEWFCQSCGEKQTNVLPSYMVASDDYEREFFRVCSNCEYEKRQSEVDNINELIQNTRKVGILVNNLENLMSLPVSF